MANWWLAARRPLLVAFATGCAVSLLATGSLTLRLALPATLYWCFVPLAEIAGLAVVLRRRLSAKAVDEYFARQRAWLLLLAVLATVWTFVPAPAAFAWKGNPMAWYFAAVAVLLWSLKIDRGYFSRVRQLLTQRLVSWIVAITIFVAPAAWQVVASKLGI